MTTADQVRELIHRCWNTPDGAGRIALADQALAYAEALGDPDIAYAARTAATSAYHQGGEPTKAMMTFARCLADYDAEPGRRSAEDERLLLWQFKFATSSMTKFPALPLDRTAAVLDDMERRYRAGGHSLHAVYAYRHRLAAHIGDTRLVDHWYRMWDTAPRDRNSDCVGCDPTSKAGHHIWFGSDEDAIAVAQGALTGQLACAEQPQSILTTLLLPYLRTGRLDDARNAHRRAYRALCDNIANLADVGQHIEFCGLTGNGMRGLELIERHLSWLERPPTPKADMDFSSSAAMVLLRLTEQGQGDLSVRRGGDPISVAALGESLRDRAIKIAEQFDARNGNTYQGDVVAARLAAPAVVDYLPLSVTAAHKVRFSLPLVPDQADPIPDVSASPLDEQLDLAEGWLRDDDPRGETLTGDIVGRFADTTTTSLIQNGRLARLRAASLGRTDFPAATAELERAVALFAEAGDLERELSTRLQLATARVQVTGEAEAAPAGVAAAEQLLTDFPDPAVRRTAMIRAAFLLAITGSTGEALSYLDRADAEPGEMAPRRRARLLVLRAGLMQQQDRTPDAAAALTEAVSLLRPMGAGDMLGGALMNLAGIRSELGDDQGTIEAFEEAAAMAKDPEMKRSARANAGFMLVGTNRAAEFVDDIVEHVCVMVAEGEDRAANYTRHRLAVALRTVGRLRESAEVAEEALAWFVTQDDETDMVTALRETLAGVYADLHEPQVALGQFALLLETAGDDPLFRAQVLERMGELLSQVDRDGEASARFEEAARLYGQADLTLATIHAQRRRTLTLHFAGRHAEAVHAAAELATLLDLVELTEDEQADLTWQRACAGYDAALILANGDTPDHAAALARIAPVPHWYRSINAFSEALAAELRQGQIFVVAGRAADASGILSRVLEQLPTDHGGRRDTAVWLARAWDEQGEKRKARKLRKEFNLPE